MKVNAILLDLGVSSMQLDQRARGFSYAVRRAARHAHGSLRRSDRRPTSSTSSPSASEVDLPPSTARSATPAQIAREIVRRRKRQPFERTGELVDAIKAAIPAPARFGDGHPARRVFQALRIAVNDESAARDGTALRVRDAAAGRAAGRDQLPLARGPARPSASSATSERGCVCPPDFPVCACGREPVVRVVSPRAVRPTRSETAQNPRAASARLRVGEKPREQQLRHGPSREAEKKIQRLPQSRPQPVTKCAPNVPRQRRASRAVSPGSSLVAALLAGVVAVNVAVLRLNLQLDGSAATGAAAAENARARLAAFEARPVRASVAAQAVGSCRRPARADLPRGARRDAGAKLATVGSGSCSSSSPWLRGLTLVRASGCRACGRALGRWRRPSSARRRHPRRARDDLRPHGCSSRSARRRTTVYANPKQVTTPARGRRWAGELGLDPDCLYPQLADRSRGFVYVAREADAAARGARRKPRRARLLPGGAARHPQRTVAAQVLGYAGVDDKGSRASSSSSTQLAGRPGAETIVKDPFGRVIDVAARGPSATARRLPDPRPHHPGAEPRPCSATP